MTTHFYDAAKNKRIEELERTLESAKERLERSYADFKALNESMIELHARLLDADALIPLFLKLVEQLKDVEERSMAYLDKWRN